jgi:hypothetical protein
MNLGILAVLFSSGYALADDYLFSNETLTYGDSLNPTYRNSEDASFNELLEEDGYTDNNLTPNAEEVWNGTASGGTWPDSITTDNDVRRVYTEASNQPDNYIEYLYPNDLSYQVEYTGTPDSTDLEHNIDDGITNDGDSSYVYPTYQPTSTIEIQFDDIETPEGSPTFALQIFFTIRDSGSGTSSTSYTMRTTSSSDYITTNYNPTTTYTTLSKGYLNEVSPAQAWTTTSINILDCMITHADITPVPYITNTYIKVFVNYSVNYDLDASIGWNTIFDTDQTTSYIVNLQGYRSGVENFAVSAWDMVNDTYNEKTTVSSSSDTDYTFILFPNEFDNVGGFVDIGIRGSTLTSDSTQDILYLDILNVCQVETGYRLDITLTSTTVPEVGDISLEIKGKITTEYFNVSVWNYTTDSWDLNETVVDTTDNTWISPLALNEVSHRSGTTVKIKFVDNNFVYSDTIQNRLYLDAVFVNCSGPSYTNPSITDYGAVPEETYEDTPILFFLTTTDAENQVMSYVRLYLNDTYFSMTENNTEDDNTDDGKAWLLTKSDISIGWYNYYFAIKDANSEEITSVPGVITVQPVPNEAPFFTSTPETDGTNNTLYIYNADATDPNLDALTYDLDGNITLWATINPSTGVVSGTPTTVGTYWMNVGVTDEIADTVWQNTTVTISEEPEEPPPPPSEGLSTNQVVIFVLICLFLAIILIWGIGAFD